MRSLRIDQPNVRRLAMRPPTAWQRNVGRFQPAWWRKAGLIGFGFFFIKGLLWLTVPLMLYWLG
jgi:hypothetical protein